MKIKSFLLLLEKAIINIPELEKLEEISNNIILRLYSIHSLNDYSIKNILIEELKKIDVVPVFNGIPYKNANNLYLIIYHYGSDVIGYFDQIKNIILGININYLKKLIINNRLYIFKRFLFEILEHELIHRKQFELQKMHNSNINRKYNIKNNKIIRITEKKI